MWDLISQWFIAILGVLAIVMVAKKNKWGFVIGLISQPFWFITSFSNHQWGVFIMSFAATASWMLGVYEWFYKKENENKS